MTIKAKQSPAPLTMDIALNLTKCVTNEDNLQGCESAKTSMLFVFRFSLWNLEFLALKTHFCHTLLLKAKPRGKLAGL